MSNKKSSGIGFFSLLGLLFIGLKLGGVINWSWWLVTLPIWGGAALILIFLLIFMFIAMLAVIANRR
jgi:hypothetical protein